MNLESTSRNESPNRLAELFASMEKALDDRSARLAPEIAAAPMFGPCPACKSATTPLDRSATEEESVAHNRLVPVYAPCGACEAEAAVQERLARYGVPRRVRGATFANYETPEKGQAEAVAAVRDWARTPSALFLLLLGKCGTGKGHLASAAIRESGLSARWTTHADMVNDYHDLPMSEGKRKAYRDRFQRHSLLVIDEIGAKGMTSDTPELFFGILNARHDEGLKTILIGNIPLKAEPPKPSVLAILGEDRAESRLFANATMIYPRWGDWRMRKA